MTLSIKGKERIALHSALGSAFQSYEVLRRMGLNQLDFDLNQRTHAAAGISTAVDELIYEMDESMGRQGIVLLIEAARAERPNNPALREIEQSFMGTADPLADVYPSAAVASKVSTRDGLERVIVDAAGLPSFAQVVSRLGSAEYRVCLVDYRQPDGHRVCGTAFLVANNLVMTNEHVIARAVESALPGSKIELAFGFRSKESHAARYKLVDHNWLVVSDTKLDYAILRIQGNPGSDTLVNSGTAERGYFKLVNETPQENEPLLILQHPYDKLEGSPSTLRLTIGFAHKQGEPPYVLRHSANTSEGSSGSPVFSGRMDVIALHNWGGSKYNEAIRAGAIKEHLESLGQKDLLG